jgi:hypothetical protein
LHDRTPLKSLIAGDIDAVVSAAACYGEPIQPEDLLVADPSPPSDFKTRNLAVVAGHFPEDSSTTKKACYDEFVNLHFCCVTTKE